MAPRCICRWMEGGKLRLIQRNMNEMQLLHWKKSIRWKDSGSPVPNVSVATLNYLRKYLPLFFFFFISALKTLVISSVNESPVHYRKYIPAGISLPHHVLFLNKSSRLNAVAIKNSRKCERGLKEGTRILSAVF